MGRESSLRTKELFNPPLPVLKALGTSVALPFTLFIGLGVPEQALGGIPYDLGLLEKINFLNFHVHRVLSPGRDYDLGRGLTTSTDFLPTSN